MLNYLINFLIYNISLVSRDNISLMSFWWAVSHKWLFKKSKKIKILSLKNKEKFVISKRISSEVCCNINTQIIFS